jgi:hypothetical protein
MTSEPASDDQEALSPELVLVSSAAVAQRAREALPGPIAPVISGAGEPIAVRPPPPAYPRVDIEDLPAKPTRRIRRGSVVLLICLVAAAAGVEGYRTTTPWQHSTPTRHVAGLAALPTPTVPVPALARRPTPPQRETSATGQPAQTPQSADTAQPRSSPAGAAGFVPSRSWVWLRRDGAVGYEVTFFLDGRVVLRARSKTPRFVMPRRFRFHAGRYRWTVRALPAGAARQAIVDSGFVLTPAAAAAANGA